MPRRIEQYRWKRKANLSSWAEVWGPILTDLDLRIAALEQLGEFDAAALVNSIYAYAINILNTNFSPLIVDAQHRLANLGVSFAASSATPVELPPSGSLTLYMPESVATGYVYTDYISCRSAADQNNQFLGLVTGFQRSITENFTAASSLNIASVSSFGVQQPIPSYLPPTGTLHIGTREIEYTDYTGSVFTIVPTDFSGAYAITETSMLHVVYGALVVDVVSSEGTGTYSDWLIRVGTPPDLTHADRRDNPHCVTAAQLGNPAGSAPAYTTAQTYTRAEIDAAIAAMVASFPTFDDSPLMKKAQNLADVVNVTTARINLGLKALAVLDQVAWGNLVSNLIATGADLIANSAQKLVHTNGVWNAATYKSLIDASYVYPDLNSGLNFAWTFTSGGGWRVLAAPNNPKQGQSGYIDVRQSPYGGTVLGFQSGYNFDNGVAPSIDTVADRVTQLGYHVRNTYPNLDVRIYLCQRGSRYS